MLEKQRKEPGDAVVSTVLFDNETNYHYTEACMEIVPEAITAFL